jgi:apolipoprotein N-acyltransferase
MRGGQRLVALVRRSWVRALLAVLLGAGVAFSFPPWHLWPLLVIGFSGYFALLQSNPKQLGALWLGWSFGFGYFLVGVHWVGYAFLVDAERFGWMMPGAVVLLAAGLALFSAGAAWLAHALTPAGWPRLFGFAASWGVAEWLRGTLFGGFPWHNLGFTWTIDLALLQAVSVIGALSSGVLTVLAVSLPALLIWPPVSGRGRVGLATAGCVVALIGTWIWGQHRLESAPQDHHPGIYLRIVQGAIPQELKWKRELRDAHLGTYLSLSRQTSRTPVDLVIWPESATPFLLERDLARLKRIIAQLAPGQRLITGTPRVARTQGGTRRLYNGVIALDSSGLRLADYNKVHLVPFGEYLPFRDILARVGLDKLAPGAVDYSAGQNSSLIELDGIPVFRPLVCYEILFPREIVAGGRPDWLLNLTNDAWFGLGAGPAQHLEIARVRAVEQGLPLVRAANTGISAIIDAYGRTQAQLPLQQSGVVDGRLPANRPATVFSQFGNGPFWALVIAFLAIGAGPKLARARSRIRENRS